MPRIRVNDVELHYVERGSGEETVVFSHSYLADHRHFDCQIAALESRYRVIAFDHRDHGESGKPQRGYPFQSLVEDALGLMDATGAGPCHWVGLSTGGFVGMRLAIHHPERLRSLVLMDTSSTGEPALNRLKYQGMFLALRVAGVKPLMNTTMKLMFGKSSFANPTLSETLATWKARMAANDPKSLIRFGNAIFSRDDVTDLLRGVDLPTLVMVGAQDLATPPGLARKIAASIPNAQLEIIENAGHLSTLEAPDAINRAILEFLSATSTQRSINA